MDVVGIFISPLLQAVIDKLLFSDLINLARREGVDTSIKKLKKSFEDINDVLADAEEKQISDRAVNKWLKELQHLAYDADDVLDEFSTEALRKKLIRAETDADVDVGEASTSRKVRRFLLPTCCTGFTPSTISFNFAIESKLKEINGQLQDVTTRIKELGLVKKAIGGMKSTNVWQRPETTYLVKEPSVYGREEKKKQIIELLLRDAATQNKVDVIPIVGMGGVGKTTLAQLICDDNGVKNHFDLKAWVCVSDEFDVKRITKAILDEFTLDSCNLTELNTLQRKLEDTLAGKKFLLVLDDVWNHRDEEWSSLQSPFRAAAHGSKIIVTTRITTVARQVGTIEHHDLKELSPDDCWSIFAQHAFKNINISEHPELESIGRQIVAKCGGLPLAARALGGLLQCNQNEHEWKMVLTSNIWDKSYEESHILPSLKLSYHHLPSHLKRCFGYCAIVPKDYEFEEDELVLLWMAEGLIEHPEGGEQIEDVGRRYFHELVSRSFFQLSRHDKLLFIMHDLINDLAQAVAGDICFRLENNLEGGKQNKISDKARHSSYVVSDYEGIRKFKAFDDARCLRTFLEFLPSRFFNYKTRYLIHDLLPVLKCLRELRLCSSGIDELPDSIGDLKHLRYIDVSHSQIKKLPDSVVTLCNLQVLFLKFCVKLQKLPLNIGMLVNLRHFDMTGVHIPSLEEMSLHIGKLINLQTLSNFMVGKEGGPYLLYTLFAREHREPSKIMFFIQTRLKQKLAEFQIAQFSLSLSLSYCFVSYISSWALSQQRRVDMDVVGIFISPLLQAVIDKLLFSDLINLARREGVDTSIKKLKKSFEDINDVLADAEEKQISHRAVNKWLKELQHLAYDADDVLDEFSTEALRKKLYDDSSFLLVALVLLQARFHSISQLSPS